MKKQKCSNEPYISLITVSYNSEQTIKDTIESILNQNYEKIEYIIIDGLSVDSTVEIANSYKSKFNEKGYLYTVISEADKGLYDAMNKGVEMAVGEIIGILNSDDFYVNDNVISNVVDMMVVDQSDCLYADLEFVDAKDTSKVVRIWKANRGEFQYGWNPPHPTTFIRKEIYIKVGNYKISMPIAADYDLLYRVINSEIIKISYLQESIVKMRHGGKSTSGIKSNIEGNREIYRSLKENGQRFKLVVIFMRLFRKLQQYNF